MECLPSDIGNRLVSRKANSVFLRFSLDRVKFLGNLIFSIGIEKTAQRKKEKNSVRIGHHKKKNSEEKNSEILAW